MGTPRSPGPQTREECDVFTLDGTTCRGESRAAHILEGGGAEAVLDDQDACKCRRITTTSCEFRSNYVDYNIVDVDYWSTAYTSSDKKYRQFWVNYCDGRRLKFSLDDVPVRYDLSKAGGRWARAALRPRRYIKRGGFIYPEFFGEGSTPTLIDIATTIAFNHRQKEKYLEVATVSFSFAVILSAYAGPPQVKDIPRVRRPGGASPARGGAPRKAPVPPGEAMAEELRARYGKVGVNLGGKTETPHYINVNSLIDGTHPSAVPNLIKESAEKLASLFRAGSVDHIIAQNIVPGTMNWNTVAKACYVVLKNRGVVELAEFGGGYEKGVNIQRALEAAGFKQIINGGVLVRAVKP